MSTMTLVILATVTAVLGVFALTLVRWREKKRLERAREIVHRTDNISLLGTIGTDLQPWVSVQMLRFFGSSIYYHAQALTAAKATINQSLYKTIQQALDWKAATRTVKSPLPTDTKQGQHVRDTVRSLLGCLREAYKEKQLSARDAKSLMQEARLLNIRITLAVLEEKIGTATKLHNHFQASHYLRKAEELLTQQQDLPSEFTQLLENIRKRAKKHDELHKNNSKPSRLEEGTAMLSTEDNSWRKKRFD